MRKAVVPICVILFIMFIGCYLIIMEYAKDKAAERAANENVSAEPLEDAVSAPSQDEGIQGILLGINEDDKLLDFQDIDDKKIYSIPYDEGIKLMSRHGSMMTMAELEKGEIYKLYYTRSIKKLTGLQVSDSIWTYTDVNRFSFDEHKKIMTIGDEAYKFTKELKIYSLGNEAQIMDITEMDTLTVRGRDKEVLSVVVDKGHGYVRVLNDAYFIGGWIEIGQDIIKPVTEDMLIPVGEGDYLVKVTNRGYAGEEEVTIKRDRETNLDLSKIEIEEVAIGHIQFRINPDYARLYIDDEITEFEERVPLEYGIHAIRVECAGYDTIRSNIKVGSEYAEIDITMDEEDEDEDKDKQGSSTASSSEKTADTVSRTDHAVSSNTVSSGNAKSTVSRNSSAGATDKYGTVSSNETATSSSGTASTVISGDKKILIEQPAGVMVYIDGAYVGVAPVSTQKVTGTHVITLSREGCQTKSYTVNISSEGGDVTFSFSALNEN